MKTKTIFLSIYLEYCFYVLLTVGFVASIDVFLIPAFTGTREVIITTNKYSEFLVECILVVTAIPGYFMLVGTAMYKRLKNKKVLWWLI